MKKKTKIKKRYKKKEKNGLIKFIFLTGFVILLCLALFSQSSQKQSPSANIASEIASNTPRKSLQLETFKVATTTPSPTVPAATLAPRPLATQMPQNTCGHDNGQQSSPACSCQYVSVVCKDRKCVSTSVIPGNYAYEQFTCEFMERPGENWCGLEPLAPGGTGTFCLAKPIVYLYPTTPTYIDVSVITPGNIVVSDPLYPDGGWKNVLAYPSGKLDYGGKSYKELFYETDITHINKPIHGISLESNHIAAQLDSILTKYGLVDYEKQEFLDFWVPRLQALNSPFIFFSVLGHVEKDRIDTLQISPKPDTLIEFIAYFRPISLPFVGPELILPVNPPNRIGFTAVEWGGVLENEEGKITLY